MLYLFLALYLMITFAKGQQPPPADIIDLRVKRLEALAVNQLLVEDYAELLINDFPILNSVSRHLVRSVKSFSILPRSDSECQWDFWQERCVPRCLCSWKPRFGDLHPSRACRLTHTQQLVPEAHGNSTPCDDSQLSMSPSGPIRRSLDWAARILRTLLSHRVPPKSLPALP